MTNVEVASLVKPSERRVYSILHNNLNMREVCGCWVPRLLTGEKKQIVLIAY